MPKSNVKSIWNVDIGALIRYEELDGREYVVCPMTMIGA